MKKLILIFSLIVATLSSGAQKDAGQQLLVMESMSVYSRILKQEVHFSVCLPEDYYKGATKRYPVNYLLHGLGDDETGWLEYGSVWNFSTRAVAQGDAVPMIYIMPEAFKTYYVNDYAGTFRYEDMFVNELVPAIDSIFRTIKDARHRALTGYSMGGFGAMMLHVKHPDVFGACVPLSMSVRTDEQYMTEEASGWDDQWGKLFGVPGLKGKERITDYYKRNSPFHFLQTLNTEQKKRLNIYLLNGDDEETLCRSNEELHILMNQLAIAHEYRVVNGGHSFKVWREAMPNALRFISDCFDGKPYRGDKSPLQDSDINVKANKPLLSKGRDDKQTISGVLSTYKPNEYTISNRSFPVIMITGITDPKHQEVISQLIYEHRLVVDNCPVIVAFISKEGEMDISGTFAALAKAVKIRDGYKYRSVIVFNGNASNLLHQASANIRLNTMVLVDNTLSRQQAESLFTEKESENFERLRIFIDVPAKGASAEGNGTLHMLLRDKDHSHEYRVREGNGGFEWMSRGLNESLEYIITNFHR